VPAGAALVEAQKLGNVFAYGNFITIAINFGILALVIFMMIKQVNRLRQAPEQAATVTPAPTPEDVLLLREIRDALSRRPLADSRLTSQG
jgi:large conductance mechanosensitive channel